MHKNVSFFLFFFFLINYIFVYKVQGIILSQVTYSRMTWDRIGGVMVSVLVLGAVDRGFEPRSGQTKDYKASPLSTHN